MESKAQDGQSMDIATYYFVELVKTDAGSDFEPEVLQETQMAHLGNIKKMASEGKLLLAGPFKTGGGLFILNVNSEEEAEALMKEDPAVKKGIFKFEIRTWYTEKGMLSLENMEKGE